MRKGGEKLPRFSPPFRIRVLLSTETEEQKKRGRPGNEAKFTLYPPTPNMYCRVLCCVKQLIYMIVDANL